MLTLTIQAGLRISELAALTRQDITLGTGANVHTVGKGRKERRTPLLPATRAVLKAWLGERPALVGGKADVHVRRVTGRGVELSLNLPLGSATASEEAQLREAIVCEVVRLAGSLGVDIAPARRRPLPGAGVPSRPGAAEGAPRAA